MLYKELVEYADRAGADPLHVGGLGLTRVTAAYTAAVTPEGPPPYADLLTYGHPP